MKGLATISAMVLTVINVNKIWRLFWLIRNNEIKSVNQPQRNEKRMSRWLSMIPAMNNPAKKRLLFCFFLKYVKVKNKQATEKIFPNMADIIGAIWKS